MDILQPETYIKLCQDTANANRLGSIILPHIAEHFRIFQERPVVIWLETTGCSGNSLSLWNSIGPDLQQILEGFIDVRFWHFLMSAQGEAAIAALFQSAREYAGRFILVIEGAIATHFGFEALFAVDGNYISAAEVLKEVGQEAGQVLAVGTCAAFGGVSAARPNLSGSVAASVFLGRPVINVSGCPAHPDWVIGTLGHLMLYGAPEVNEQGQPLLFYQDTIHRHCQRRSYFDRKEFATRIGDPECMLSLGCKGPVTYADCPLRQWNSYVNWPVKANTPCIGCTNPGFPDEMEPFFEPLKEEGRHRTRRSKTIRRHKRLKRAKRRSR